MKALTVQGIQTNVSLSKGGDTYALLLHGWGGEAKGFDDLIFDLQKLYPNITFISLDFPGFGGSGFPPQSGWDTSDYAVFVLDLLSQLKIKKLTMLLGHSFGGRVMVRMLKQNPNIAENLIFVGAAGIKPEKSRKQKFAEKYKSKLEIFKKLIPQKIYKKILGRFFGARDWSDCPEALKPTLIKVLAEDDLRNELKSIQQKSLLLWGRNDGFTPISSAYVYRDYLPNAVLSIIEDGRHGIHKTHHKLLAQKIHSFLT